MMDIKLAYGKQGLTLNLPDAWQAQVVRPRFIAGLPDELAAVRGALQEPIGSAPLNQRATLASRVGIIVNDITRATPTPVLLQALFAELAHLPAENLTLFIATGTHRPNTAQELEAMLGMRVDEVEPQKALRALRDHKAGKDDWWMEIVQNEARNLATQVYLGQTSQGTPIWLNRRLLECDLVILTGFIEPHLFAGFSGGGKAIMPGMAGLATIMGNHRAEQVAHPKATWGITHGNPLWEEIHEIAGKVANTFLLNVTLNGNQEITGVYAGELRQAHVQGCAAARQAAMQPVDGLFDIVVTTNSGYPLDQNLYQSVKGLSAAAQIVRPGGAIVIATRCQEGIPEHGEYRRLLSEARNPEELLHRVRLSQPTQDLWQVQIQAQILQKAEVYVYSEGLTPEQIRQAHLQPVESVEATLARLMEKHGPGARLCVLPEGPLTIPYIR